MPTLLRLLPLALLLLGLHQEAAARTKLITLPVREHVAVQLDHPAITLVEEERVVPLAAGENQLDFSWANTRIDPDTIVLRILGDAAASGLEARLLSVSYPPGENALVWSVYSSAAGAARVRISYTLGGLGKQFHYRALTSQDEKRLQLNQFLRVDNGSGEAFEAAGIWPGFGTRTEKPLGLSESKEVLFARYDDLPVRKSYTCDPRTHGYLDEPQKKLNVLMHYVLGNDLPHGLGKTPLPYGKARIFQEDGKGGNAFIGEDWARTTPVGEELKLYLGLAQDVVVRRTIDRSDRTRVAGDLYSYDIVVKYEIENFKDRPVTLDISEHARDLRAIVNSSGSRDPEWTLGSESTVGRPDPEHSDADRLLFHVELPARKGQEAVQKQVHKLHLVIRNEW